MADTGQGHDVRFEKDESHSGAQPASLGGAPRAAEKRAADARAGNAALARMAPPTPDILQRYPKMRMAYVSMVAASRRDLQGFIDDQGVVGHVSDAVESGTQTVESWYDWMRGAKKARPKHETSPPPVSMYDAVDRAVAAADAAYAAHDAQALKQCEAEVNRVFHECNTRFASYLDGTAQGASTVVEVCETTSETGATVVGFAVGGPAGAAAGAGLAKAGVDVIEAKAAGEHIDWKTIGLASVKEAASTLAFALVAGPIGEKVFLPLLTKALGPAISSVLGSVTAETVDRYVAGFMSGVGTGTVLNAVQLEVARMHGGVKMSEGEFVDAVVKDMLRGGVQQIFIDSITHGAAHLSGSAHADAALAHATPTPEVHAAQDAHAPDAPHGPTSHGAAAAHASTSEAAAGSQARTARGVDVRATTEALAAKHGAGAESAHGGAEVETPLRPRSESSDPRAARLDKLQDRLDDAYPHGYVVKPVNAMSSGSVPTSKQSFADILDGKEGPSNHKAWMEDLLSHPDEYLVQELIDIRRSRAMISRPTGTQGSIEFFGQVKDEYRVHVVNGKVVPHATLHRWSLSRNLNPFSSERTRVEQQVQAMLDQMPDELKLGTPMALDAAIDTSGNVHVIESNPGGQSGFLKAPGDGVGVPSAAPQALYKHVTGRDTKAMATLKGVGAGVAGTAATGNPLVGLGLGVGVYHRARTIEYSSDPQIAEMQRAAKGRLSWIEGRNDGQEKSTGVRGFLRRQFIGADDLVEESNSSWGTFSATVQASLKRNGHLTQGLRDTRALRRYDNAVFVAGEASQALRYRGTVNLGGDVENIFSQQGDKVRESDTWNQYAPGSIGRAELLSKYLGPSKRTPKASPEATKAAKAKLERRAARHASMLDAERAVRAKAAAKTAQNAVPADDRLYLRPPSLVTQGPTAVNGATSLTGGAASVPAATVAQQDDKRDAKKGDEATTPSHHERSPHHAREHHATPSHHERSLHHAEEHRARGHHATPSHHAEEHRARGHHATPSHHAEEHRAREPHHAEERAVVQTPESATVTPRVDNIPLEVAPVGDASIDAVDSNAAESAGAAPTAVNEAEDAKRSLYAGPDVGDELDLSGSEVEVT